MDNTINNRIKEVRKALSLTQKEFAKELDVAFQLVGNIETGRQNPSYNTILLLSQKYKVSIDWLITGAGEMFLSGAPSKVMQSDAGNSKKNGLSGVDGGAEIFEGELNHTRWFRNLSPKKKVIAAALEELTDEGADRVVQGIDYELRIEESRKAALQSSEDKSLRQKGEAG